MDMAVISILGTLLTRPLQFLQAQDEGEGGDPDERPRPALEAQVGDHGDADRACGQYQADGEREHQATT